MRLSESAEAVLCQCFEGNPPEPASHRDAYRELVAAGLMIPVSGFRSGEEAFYRLTDRAVARAEAEAVPARRG